MRLGIKGFHAFIKGPFKKRLLESYEKYEICSEADLECHARNLISDFLEEADPEGKRFRVSVKPYFKDIRIHPDIAVFKRDKPWVLLELKERKQLSEKSARNEQRRLIKAQQHCHPRPKRGYLVYVSRYGDKRALSGPRREGARFFFEIPIVLEECWTRERVAEWEQEFKRRSKFTIQA